MYYGYNHLRATQFVDRRETTTGKVIRQWREINNISQKDLATAVCNIGRPYGIKVHPATISAYEREICQPKTEISWALRQVMRMNEIQFAGYKIANYHRP